MAVCTVLVFPRAKLGTENYWAHGATRNGIFVRRSLDGGRTWEKDASVVISHPTEPGIPFEDKPYIVADATHSKYAGNLYIGWTEFSLEKTIMLFARSTDAPMRPKEAPAVQIAGSGA